MKTLTDKLQQRTIWLKGSIESWDRIIEKYPDSKYMYKPLRDRKVSEYEVLTGEKYKK